MHPARQLSEDVRQRAGVVAMLQDLVSVLATEAGEVPVAAQQNPRPRSRVVAQNLRVSGLKPLK